MADNNSKDIEIPGMTVDNKYSTKSPVIPETSDKMQKELEKTKKEVDKLKKWVVKKYPFTQALSIIDPRAIPIFIEEEEVPKPTEKHVHLYMVVPEEKYKEIPTIQKEVVKEIEKIKGQKIWIQIKTPIDIFENCLDSKFALTQAIAMSFPLHDTGFLGALRVAEIHKSLVLRKFEKYVVSYVIGGSLVRGEAVPTSDVDVFVIVDDTDVKKMTRLELKDRLRGIIYKYVSDAAALAGVQNKLEPQIYLLTDFWESVKDAHPVMFTFIRDGIPIYDRGTFMPWKALLRMGKLKPSPEAIDMFMSMADRTKDAVDRRLMDAGIDLYYGVLTPSQALIMLNGFPPPTPKETPKVMKEVFVDKEKMLEPKYIKILEKAVKIFKDYEHQRIKTIPGKEVDQLVKNFEDYVKRLKELRVQIEKRYNERTIEQIYGDVFDLLKRVIGNKSESKIIEDFEKNFVKRGIFTSNNLRVLKSIVEARKEFKKGKGNSKQIDDARKNSTLLMNSLIEYTQRCDLAALDKSRMFLEYSGGNAELVNANGITFLLRGNNIKKLTNKVEDAHVDEIDRALVAQKEQQKVQIDSKIFKLLEKELGDFKILI